MEGEPTTEMAGEAPEGTKKTMAQAIGNEYKETLQEMTRLLKTREVKKSERMEQYLERLRKFYDIYFGELGIEEASWPKAIMLVDEIPQEIYQGKEVVDVYGVNTPDTVAVVQNPAEAEISNDNLREYLQAELFAHEIYHSSLKASVNGDALYHGDDVLQPALEEGLATRIQIQSRELIKEFFPEGAEVYNAIKAQVAGDPDVRGDLIDLNFSQQGIGLGYSRYAPSVVLVEFLEKGGEAVPRLFAEASELDDSYTDFKGVKDFNSLVEKARVEGETTPLKAAIDENFGEGSYDKLVHTESVHALTTIGQLVNERKSLLESSSTNIPVDKSLGGE